jgi:hypothetical protein
VDKSHYNSELRWESFCILTLLSVLGILHLWNLAQKLQIITPSGQKSLPFSRREANLSHSCFQRVMGTMHLWNPAWDLIQWQLVDKSHNLSNSVANISGFCFECTLRIFYFCNLAWNLEPVTPIQFKKPQRAFQAPRSFPQLSKTTNSQRGMMHFLQFPGD